MKIEYTEAKRDVTLAERGLDMARAAGMPGIAVGWGYHPATELGSAIRHVATAAELPGAVDAVLEREATA